MKKEATRGELAQLCEAAELNKGLDGFSISGSKAKLAEITKLTAKLSESESEIVRETARRIQSQSKKKSREGLFGDGMFLMD